MIWAALLLLAVTLLTGCGAHKKVIAHIPPPPPPIPQQQPEPEPQPDSTPPEVTPEAKVLSSQEGFASWYGPPYHNRRTANGEVYDMHSLTAAHRTLPLNSVVRVTNLKTDHSVVVRITDRGPFVPNRIIDLSMAAAKEVDVWRPGTAKVRVDVLEAPASLDVGGRWCVQIGGIKDEEVALDLKDRLSRRYKTAKVLEFPSPVGDFWVRVRVDKDDRRRAEEVAQENTTPEGNIFLVRLD
jgi:peptidoglycan lytic transglycosylase